MINKKNIQIFFLFILFIFGCYCALTIGKSWDTFHFINAGKDRLRYLLSLGFLPFPLYFSFPLPLFRSLSALSPPSFPFLSLFFPLQPLSFPGLSYGLRMKHSEKKCQRGSRLTYSPVTVLSVAFVIMAAVSWRQKCSMRYYPLSD